MSLHPKLVVLDETDQRLVYAMLGSNYALQSAVYAYGGDLRVVQFAAAVRHPMSVPTFGLHVSHVYLLVAAEQMVEFIACAVVAAVKYVNAWRYRSVRVFPRFAMHVEEFLSKPFLAVTSFGFRARPYFARLHASYYSEVMS